MDYLIKFGSRFVKLTVFYVKDIYMFCKECYAAWWLRDDKSQASIRRDILKDPQNIPGVAVEQIVLFFKHNFYDNAYHGY